MSSAKGSHAFLLSSFSWIPFSTVPIRCMYIFYSFQIKEECLFPKGSMPSSYAYSMHISEKDECLFQREVHMILRCMSMFYQRFMRCVPTRCMHAYNSIYERKKMACSEGFIHFSTSFSSSAQLRPLSALQQQLQRIHLCI